MLPFLPINERTRLFFGVSKLLGISISESTLRLIDKQQNVFNGFLLFQNKLVDAKQKISFENKNKSGRFV